MQKGLAIISLLALAAAAPGAAYAAVTPENFRVRTAGDLADLCAAGNADAMRTAAINFCEGFLVGTYQTLEEWQMAHKAKLFCPPAHPPTRDEAVQAFATWVWNSPSEQNERPADAFLRFLTEKLPCPGGQQ